MSGIHPDSGWQTITYCELKNDAGESATEEVNFEKVVDATSFINST